MAKIALVLFAVSTLFFVSGNMFGKTTPFGFVDHVTEQTTLLKNHPGRTMSEGENTVLAVGLIPWRCFAKQNNLMCSCTVLTGNYVLARSACMKTATTDKIEVYAGATHPENADQIVTAAVLNADEPAPEGIVVLKLDQPLQFDNNVGDIKLFPQAGTGIDFKPGAVSGFRYEKGNYQHEYYGAMIEETKCAKNRLCAFGPYWPDQSFEESKATDFLDYFDEDTSQFYLAGVLDRHSEPTDATYYKVKEMIPWMQKYLPGIIIGNSSGFYAPDDLQGMRN